MLLPKGQLLHQSPSILQAGMFVCGKLILYLRGQLFPDCTVTYGYPVGDLA